ncbi:hypothetical protein [Archangium violaceum]|uniref:Uncharacterized protein n=1 Tax=Archangium violaceum Cb vi76 TaxID=1406225 RepID=A0A084SKL6_9BACT|nr:hypothetical protein [Archangium violaceum]KFA89001.1 hypothetical protein Q664_37700 [Archangium violaceum Cb vi76]
MPRAFDVTASTAAVQLSPGRDGEVSFTVSNALHLPLRVRASVEPSGTARSEWMRLREEESRELAPDGTAVFTVKVAVPPGAPEGEYAFKLLVVDVANPDEHYARSPSVAFTVAVAPAPAKKPFPWMWVALAAGVLLLAGGVVAFLLSRGDGDGTGGSGVLPGLSQPCAEGEPRCAGGLVCTGESLCLGDTGFACGEDASCASQRCVEGTCQPPLGLGSACEADRDCLEPLRCHEGLCLQPDGSPCTSAAQCISSRCEEGTCTATVPPGGGCTRDADCESPGRCERGRCQLPDGQSCTGDAQCLSGRCVGGSCRARVSPGGRCGSSSDCEPPARCESNRCVLREGASCSRGTECESGNCQSGICRPECFPPCGPGRTCSRGRCAIVRRHCDDNSDCESPMRCSDGTCRLPAGQPCALDSQCLSGSCVRSRCR